mgnify:CR=1 FL=1
MHESAIAGGEVLAACVRCGHAHECQEDRHAPASPSESFPAITEVIAQPEPLRCTLSCGHVAENYGIDTEMLPCLECRVIRAVRSIAGEYRHGRARLSCGHTFQLFAPLTVGVFVACMACEEEDDPDASIRAAEAWERARGEARQIFDGEPGYVDSAGHRAGGTDSDPEVP